MALYLNTDNLHDLPADSSWDDKRDTEALLYLEIARDCWSRANPNA